MYLFKKILTRIFINIIPAILIISFSSYAIGPGEHKKTVAVIGDSYAESFKNNISSKDLNFYFFREDGISNEANVNLFKKCIENYDNSYILFCTGIVDYTLKTSYDTFETYLRVYANLAKRYDKYLFFHTYMDFPEAKDRKDKYIINVYNDLYKKIADEFPNVYYIDMKNLQNDYYSFGDGIHYGKLFYETLYAKLMYLVDSIEVVHYTASVPWITIADHNSITVTGDSYAGTFTRFESNKDFKLTELTKDGNTIKENYKLLATSMITQSKYVVISIGVNDYEDQTNLNEFEDTLRQILNLACHSHKKVFMHTYMHYQAEKSKKIKLIEYDKIIKKLCDEYSFNTIYIDMHKYEAAEYQMADLRHYNKIFYDSLYNTIKDLIKQGV